MIKWGDFHAWCTQNLHSELDKVIGKNLHRDRYFLLVIVNNGYDGPPTGDGKIRPTKEVDLSTKTVMHCIINIIDRPPLIRLIGSSLWEVDNRIGLARCVYSLPPERPTRESDDSMSSELVHRSAKNMPLRNVG